MGGWVGKILTRLRASTSTSMSSSINKALQDVSAPTVMGSASDGSLSRKMYVIRNRNAADA